MRTERPGQSGVFQAPDCEELVAADQTFMGTHARETERWKGTPHEELPLDEQLEIDKLNAEHEKILRNIRQDLARRILRRLNLKGQFVSIMSHQVRVLRKHP